MEKNQMEILKREYANLWKNYDWTVQQLVKSDKADDIQRWKEQKSKAVARLRQHERVCNLLGYDIIEDTIED